MSEHLAAAAAAMGLPEAIVERSASARAAETGMSVDEILSAWAGGGSVPPPAPAAADEIEETPAADLVEPAPADEVPSVATPVAQPASAPPPAPVYAGPYKPPTLVGAADNPMTVVIAAVALFVAVFLVGVVGSALVEDEPGARTSDIAYTAGAESGKELYVSLGCGSCHTQMVRPIISDVGLGPVTVSDSNQILGTRRFGPDLTNVASRMTPAQIEAILDGFSGHLDAGLSSGDVDDLVAYLMETSQ